MLKKLGLYKVNQKIIKVDNCHYLASGPCLISEIKLDKEEKNVLCVCMGRCGMICIDLRRTGTREL